MLFIAAFDADSNVGVQKRMSCRDLIPWVVGHCECSFGPLRRSVCRCCGSSARVFFHIEMKGLWSVMTSTSLAK